MGDLGGSPWTGYPLPGLAVVIVDAAALGKGMGMTKGKGKLPAEHTRVLVEPLRRQKEIDGYTCHGPGPCWACGRPLQRKTRGPCTQCSKMNQHSGCLQRCGRAQPCAGRFCVGHYVEHNGHSDNEDALGKATNTLRKLGDRPK